MERERLLGERRDLREAIVAESMRILDGANDIDPLKEVAARYRQILAELGETEPTSDEGIIPTF